MVARQLGPLTLTPKNYGFDEPELIEALRFALSRSIPLDVFIEELQGSFAETGSATTLSNRHVAVTLQTIALSLESDDLFQNLSEKDSAYVQEVIDTTKQLVRLGEDLTKLDPVRTAQVEYHLRAEAAWSHRNGDGHRSELAWALAQDTSRRHKRTTQALLLQATSALRHANGAVVRHLLAELKAEGDPSLPSHGLLSIAHCYRLIGQGDQAAQTIESLLDRDHSTEKTERSTTKNQPLPPSEIMAAVTWESVMLQCESSGSLESFRSYVADPSISRPPRILILCRLFAFGQGLWEIGRSLPTAESIRRIALDGISKINPLHGIYSWLRLLERIDESDHPAVLHLQQLQQLFDTLEALPSLEEELLVLEAAASLLLRKGMPAASRVFAERRALVLHSLGQGTKGDDEQTTPKGTSKSDALQPRVAAPIRSQSPQMNAISSSLLARLGHIGLAIGASVALSHGGKGEQIFGTLMRRDAKTARRIAALLGGLKGPLMKIGQIIGTFDDLKDSVVIDELSRLNHHSKQLKPETIRKILETTYNQPVESVFSEWDDTPLAAASIGQVHRAKLKDGTPVAVKVQYPHIEKAVLSDIKLLKMLVPLVGRRFKNADVNGMANFMERCFLLECDYHEEARWQKRYQEAFRNHPLCRIPRVHENLSHRNILVSDFVEGDDFKDFIARATQEERNEAGLAIFTFMTRALYHHGWFYADPHPGNYRFKNGQVWFLDFGSVLGLEPEYHAPLREYVRTMLYKSESDWTACAAAWRTMARMAPLGTPDGFDDRLHHEIQCKTIARPFRKDETFRYTLDFVRSETQILLTENRNLHHMQVPPVYLRLVRLVWGLHSVLGKLEAEGNFHRILAEVLPPK